MVICSNCNKKIGFFSKKYFIYPGTKIGSFEITGEKIVCNGCLGNLLFPASKASDETFLNYVLFLANNKFDDALKELEKIDKRRPDYWYNKGLFLKDRISDKIARGKLKYGSQEHLKKTVDAISYFDEALLRDTHYTKAWYYKGRLLIDLKQHKNAIRCFENVIKLDPENKQRRKLGATLLIAGVYLNSKKYDLAAKWLCGLELAIDKQLYNPKHYLNQLATTFFSMRSAHHVQNVLGKVKDKLPWFLKYCLKIENYNNLLDTLVQAPAIEVNESGKKH